VTRLRKRSYSIGTLSGATFHTGREAHRDTRVDGPEVQLGALRDAVAEAVVQRDGHGRARVRGEKRRGAGTREDEERHLQ
jgi:hypothetical protein